METQLSLFGVKKKQDKEKEITEQLQVFVDGAARGNPGPAGAGIYILHKDQEIRESFFLGEKTNNQAEYFALILALYILIQKLDKDSFKTIFLTINSDSELLVKQLNGSYKIKNPILIKLNNVVTKSLRGIPHKFVHVLRDKNKVADKLANEGIDKKKKIPTNFLNFLADFNEIDDVFELLKK